MKYLVLSEVFAYALVFATAAALSVGFTALARRLALHFQVLDQPAQRKLHADPVPYLGGLGLYAAFLVFGLLLRWLIPEAFPAWFFPVALGATLLVLVGLWDDVKGLSSTPKFIAQILAVLIIYFLSDTQIMMIANPLGGVIEFGPLALPLTLVWAVMLINAINLIDGMDGLAAGVVAISSSFMFVIDVVQGDPLAGLPALGLAGVCIGFLRYNFPPARIFMGDAGSLFLGFIVAVFSMTVTGKGSTVITLLFPVLVLGIPILDTALAFLRRLSQGKHPFQGDARHIHHRFLALGLNVRQVVLVIYFFCIALGLFAIVMMRLTPSYRILTISLLALLIVFVILAMEHMERQLHKVLEEVKAYKEWVRYHGLGPNLPRTRSAGGSAACAGPAGEANAKKLVYEPPALSISITERLLSAEEQRSEKVVLVVSPEWKARLREVLGRMGHRVAEASSLDEAEARVKETDAGVVIIEAETAGPELADFVIKANTLNPTLTLLVLSSASEDGSVLGLLRLGVYHIIPACAPLEVIEVMIARCLENRYLARRMKFLNLLFWVIAFTVPVWIVVGRFIGLH